MINARCRERLIQRIDEWLARIEARPCQLGDGECHELKITADLAREPNTDGELFVTFWVEASETEAV